MISTPSKLSGYTVAEMVIAVAITTIVALAAAKGWVNLVRGERMNSIQTELDINVRTSMENLKHDLRLSALDKIYYYPAGPGPYTAISFPMTSDTNHDGIAEYATGGSNILWTSTVIYHVWKGSPTELRKTTFFPRDNSLSAAGLQAQLNSVVTNGDGRGYANETPPRVIFKNLFTWQVWGSGATYDGYSSSSERDTEVSFGSVYLGSGTHQVKFNVIGKNPASSGYSIGIDTLTASACGVEREAEAQTLSAQYGTTASKDYKAEGSWSGNYQLKFDAASTGSYFTLTIDNDRWEETNFRGAGALGYNTVVGFDPSLRDYIVQLEGNPGYPWASLFGTGIYAWTAEGQTGTNAASIATNALENCVVRVLLRGDGSIRFNGGKPRIYFQASSNTPPLHILAAYIAEASSNNYPNAVAEGTKLYFANSSSEATISTTASATPLGQFITDSSKSYLVTYLVKNNNGSAAVWAEDTSHTGVPDNTYIIRESAYPTEDDAKAASWAGKIYTSSATLYGVARMYTDYPTNGLFTSQIFDTKMDTPVYSNVSWNAALPLAATSVGIKVRTATNSTMSDAPNWTNATTFTSSPANINCGNNRYVQFQAVFNPDPTNLTLSPKLKDVTIKWAGPTKIVDIAATMTKGPNYGICEVTVDSNQLSKGLRIDLSIFKDISGWGNAGMTNTSTMTTEISPRNTGK